MQYLRTLPGKTMALIIPIAGCDLTTTAIVQYVCCMQIIHACRVNFICHISNICPKTNNTCYSQHAPKGSRRGSHGSSNASASSSGSKRSNSSVPLQEHQHQHHAQPSSSAAATTTHHPQQHHQTKQHVRAQITNVPVIEVEAVVDAKA